MGIVHLAPVGRSPGAVTAPLAYLKRVYEAQEKQAARLPKSVLPRRLGIRSRPWFCLCRRMFFEAVKMRPLMRPLTINMGPARRSKIILPGRVTKYVI